MNFLDWINTENRLNNILFITGAILVGIAAYFIIVRILSNRAKKSELKWLEISVDKIRLPLFISLLTLVAIMIVPVLAMETNYESIISHALSVLLILAVSVMLIRIPAVIVETLESEYEIEGTKATPEAKRLYTQFKVMKQIVTFIVILLAIGAVLMTFEKVKQVGVSVLASAGIAGVIVGFAAQKFLGTVIAGIQLAFTQPIYINDFVVINKEIGTVEEIKLTYVVIKLWDQRRLIVPTTYFIENYFENWSRISPETIEKVHLYFDFSFPVNELRDELKMIVENNENWDGKVCTVEVFESDEYAMQLRILVSGADPDKAYYLKMDVREKLIDFIQGNYSDYLARKRSQSIEESVLGE